MNRSRLSALFFVKKSSSICSKNVSIYTPNTFYLKSNIECLNRCRNIHNPHGHLLPINSLLVLQSRAAGHSKWQNIKEIKTTNDQARSSLFQKLSLQIKIALKDGSANPVSNFKLAAAIDNAKKHNMPKASINNIIESSQKTMQNAKQHYFEYRGLNNLCLLVEAFTDNIKRARSNVNGALKKHGYREDKQMGAVRNMFNELGIVMTSVQLNENVVSHDQAEEHAIEVGAEEVEITGDAIQFTCGADDLYNVRNGLLKYGYTVDSTDIHFTPISPIPLDDAGLEAVAAAVTKLEELEEVVRVHPNVD